MPSCTRDGTCWKQVLTCDSDVDGGEIMVMDNKMLKGGDDEAIVDMVFVSFLPPKCEFCTSWTKTERATMREAYAFAVQEPS